MKVLSPAKINLMLKILGQRKDGYHNLQTYFQLLNWGDDMQFTLESKDEITITGNFKGLNQKDNLIDKAARLLTPYRKNKKGVLIEINKRIPLGSGLGGGSSNAGTTLRVLNEMWQCQLPQEKLLKMALSLGADVPIFVLNQSAMATGVGECFHPFDIMGHHFVLIFPNISISTVQIFADKKLNRNEIAIKDEDVCNKENWTNAFLPVVLANYPEIQEIYNRISKYAKTYLTGTGSTLFCAFDNKQKALNFINQFQDEIATQICTSKKSNK